MNNTHTLGMVWDKYTPAVEGQITRDVIALQSETPAGDTLSFVCPDGSADRLFNTLGVVRSMVPGLANVWITYRTQEDKVFAPEHATEVIERDLYQDAKDVELDPESHPGYYMKPQGRVVAPQMNRHKPAPSHYGPTDPMVVLLWSKVLTDA